MNDRESYAAGIENVCDGVRQLSVGPFGGDKSTRTFTFTFVAYHDADAANSGAVPLANVAKVYGVSGSDFDTFYAAQGGPDLAGLMYATARATKDEYKENNTWESFFEHAIDVL